MKKFKLYIGAVLLSITAVSCDIDGLPNDVPSLNNVSSTKQDGVFTISNDNTGNVRITPEGEGFVKAVVTFGDSSGVAGSAVVRAGESVVHNYAEGSYTVKIVYYDIAGKEYAKEYPLKLTYRAPEDLTVNESQNGYTITVNPKAEYANGYQIYFGENAAESPVTVGKDEPASHMYKKAGNYDIRIVALSGGAATLSATKTITIYDALAFPMTFEQPFVNYNVGETFGGVGVEIVDNPFKTGINTSDKVYKYIKSEGAETWSGSYLPFSEPGSVPINMDKGMKFTVMVYATEAGKLMNFELEKASNGVENQVLKMPVTVANQWQVITFDFGALGTIPEGTVFTQMDFRYNDAASGSGEILYIDNITQLK